ncbi:tripartite tricarboxylate transporter TctB family protein [Kribbella sp. CA-253562]|uniref:tripartite tricarboxylate transporter TctB family protein n=1 Tax=Kribbella sp. CA-253562 TaxID=3239942 RepID=UPI003D94BC15
MSTDATEPARPATPASATTDPGATPSPGATAADAVAGEPVRTADVEVEASRLVRIIAAVVLVVLSSTFLIGVFDIRSPKGLDPQGPRFFPLLVTSAWLLLSLGYLVEGLRSPRHTAQTEPAETGGGIAERSWFEPVAISALLVLYAFLVVPLGYLIATALLFFAAARVLGSRQLVRDIVVAVVLAVVVYIAFTQFLDISLPEGVLGL